MKVNKAPDRIYFGTQQNTTNPFSGLTQKCADTDIEYVRKDALVKKAIGYIDSVIEFLNEYGHQLKKERIIEDFKKYMEE